MILISKCETRFCLGFEWCDRAYCIFLLLNIMLQLINLSAIMKTEDFFFGFITAVFLSTEIFSLQPFDIIMSHILCRFHFFQFHSDAVLCP